MVRTLAVTFSPAFPVAARGAEGQPPALVGQGHGQAVDLQLRHVGDVVRAEELLDPRVKGPQILGAVGIGQAEQRDPVGDRLEDGQGFAPHPQRGRVRRLQVRDRPPRWPTNSRTSRSYSASETSGRSRTW